MLHKFAAHEIAIAFRVVKTFPLFDFNWFYLTMRLICYHCAVFTQHGA